MALIPLPISSLSEHAPKRFSDSYPFAGGDPFGTYRHTFRQLVNGGLTGMTGGGATNLDGWTTVGEDVNQVFNVISGSSVYSYVLAAGTDSQSLPDVVRPLDYASSTNEKVFRRLTPYGTVTTLGLTPPGYVVALSATTFASRVLTGTANQITVTNGDGASGSPVFSLPASVIGVNGLTSQAASNLALATGTGVSLNITLTPGTSGAVQSVFGANTFGIDNGGPGSTPRLVSNSALQLTSSGLYAVTLQGGSSGASLEVGSGANGAVTVTPAGSGSLTVGTASNGVVLYPQGLSTFAVTTTSPVNDNYHFIQVSPVITSAGSLTDVRALSVDSELAGSANASGNRALRLRALTSSSSSANLGVLQGISSSQTHQGSGLVTLMNAYQGSMNLWGTGNATLVEYFRANAPNFISSGIIAGLTKGLAIYDIGSVGSTGVYGAWVDDLTKPGAADAYGYWTQMGAGAGGKWAFYGSGTAPSYLGGALTVGSSTASTSAATGALVVTGGVGVGGSGFFGGNITSSGSITASGSTSLDGLSASGVFGGTKRIMVGYDTGGDYGYITAVDHGVGWKELRLNPLGGVVKVPNTTSSTSTTSGSLVISGGLGLAENLVQGGYARWLGNSVLPGQGSIGKSATYGLNIYAATGSSYDFVLFSAAGTSLILNPTGTTTLIAAGVVSLSSTTASTSTTTGALVVSGGVGVAGAGFFGGNIQSNAVFAANNTTLYLRPGGAEVSAGQMSVDTSGNVATAGNLSVGGTLGSVDMSGRLRVVAGGFASYGSLTLGAAYASMGGGFQTSYDAPTTRIFYGDGSGFDLRFATRLSSTTTDRATLSDTGTLTLTGNLLVVGSEGMARVKSANGTTGSPVEDRVVTWTNSNGLLDEAGMYGVNTLLDNSQVFIRFKAIDTAGSAVTVAEGKATGFAILGTTTNDDAATGYVGEFVTATLASGSAIGLTSAAPANITSISLTAGDWDVEGAIVFVPTASTVRYRYIAGVGVTSATLGSADVTGLVSYGDADGNGYSHTVVTPVNRIRLSSTTTVYLVARGDFGVSTLSAFGTIRARRAR